MAEQRRLYQRRRDRGAVEREVGFVRARREPVQASRDQFLAAAGLAFDQHRERRAGELRDLAFQFHQRRALADQFFGATGVAQFRVAYSQRPSEDLLQHRRVAGLGDEFGGAQCARMARVGGVVLPGENENAHLRRMREQVGDQLKAFVRRVRRGWQAQVHQRQLWRVGQLAQQLDRMQSRFTGEYLELGAQRKCQRVRDQGVVIDDEEPRAALRC